jgi:hypothetical protein
MMCESCNYIIELYNAFARKSITFGIWSIAQIILVIQNAYISVAHWIK